MQNIYIMSRLGGTALAAVLALSATPAFAQEATPQITVPQEQAAPAAAAPVTVAPVTTPAPVVTPDPLAAEPAAESATTPGTTEAAPAATTAKKATAKPAPAKATARTTSAPRASAAPAPPLAAPVDATLPAEVPVIDPPIPVAPLAAAPAPAPEAAPVETASNDALPIALGAGLGLLALGGAAFALRRRRRDVVEDEVIMTEPTIARTPAPVVRPEPVMADRSAFSWGTPAAAAGAATATSTRSSGKSWVERAQDGPTPENPFLSLKKRLQRAAFYDQRERAVAAGQAKPLSPMAGLPSRFAEAFKPRTTTTASSYGFSYAPA